jgi:hypothetical protein
MRCGVIDMGERDREAEARTDTVPEVLTFLARPTPGEVGAHERLPRLAAGGGVETSGRIAQIDSSGDLAFLVQGREP